MARGLAYCFVASESLKVITRAMTSGEQIWRGVSPWLFSSKMSAPSWIRKQATVASACGPVSSERPKLSHTCIGNDICTSTSAV